MVGMEIKDAMLRALAESILVTMIQETKMIITLREHDRLIFSIEADIKRFQVHSVKA